MAKGLYMFLPLAAQVAISYNEDEDELDNYDTSAGSANTTIQKPNLLMGCRAEFSMEEPAAYMAAQKLLVYSLLLLGKC